MANELAKKSEAVEPDAVIQIQKVDFVSREVLELLPQRVKSGDKKGNLTRMDLNMAAGNSHAVINKLLEAGKVQILMQDGNMEDPVAGIIIEQAEQYRADAKAGIEEAVGRLVAADLITKADAEAYLDKMGLGRKEAIASKEVIRAKRLEA